MQDPGNETSARESLLHATALAAAEAWKKDVVTELKRDGRPVEGGWPGTIAEARARFGASAAHALGIHALPALERDELGRLTRIAYDEARRLWRASDD